MFQHNDLSFIYKYFSGEKQESLLFIIIGLLGVAASIIFFFFIKTSFYKGLALPAFAIGLMLCIVGFTVYTRSDKQAKDISYNIGIDASNYIKQTELPRMEKVMKNFVAYRWIEICLMLFGIVLFFYLKNDETKSFLIGVGISLAIIALLGLAADFFAEKRGKVYLTNLLELLPK